MDLAEIHRRNADYELQRMHWETGAPYYVWVNVTNYIPEVPFTWHQEGESSEIEVEAWNDEDQDVDLTDDELSEIKAWYESEYGIR